MIVPILPALFAEPFPVEHPWHSAPGLKTGWELSPRVHLLMPHTMPELVGSVARCTWCCRGASCGLRVTNDWRRATCALCIKQAVRGGVPEATAILNQAIRDKVLDLPRKQGEAQMGRLGRAIGWWRVCGARPVAVPWYVEDFFIPSDEKPMAKYGGRRAWASE